MFRMKPSTSSLVLICPSLCKKNQIFTICKWTLRKISCSKHCGWRISLSGKHGIVSLYSPSSTDLLFDPYHYWWYILFSDSERFQLNSRPKEMIDLRMSGQCFASFPTMQPIPAIFSFPDSSAVPSELLSIVFNFVTINVLSPSSFPWWLNSFSSSLSMATFQLDPY